MRAVHGVQIQVKCDPPFRTALIGDVIFVLVFVLVNHNLHCEQVFKNLSSDMAAAQLDEGKAGFQVMLR